MLKGLATVISALLCAASFPPFKDSPSPARQHEQLFQIRAAENGRWIAVAATSGVTQIIDPAGRVTKRLPVLERAVMVLFVGLLGWRWRMAEKESKSSVASRV